MEKTHKNPASLFEDVPCKSIHFIGIGGIGTSSLAQWFLSENWAVSGSDLAENKITRDLKKLGVKVKIGHKKGNLTGGRQMLPGLVIYSQAVKPENIELRETARLGIPILSYPQAVGELTRLYKTVCVAGMHGKGTTTAFLSLIMMRAGLDPTVIIGTKLKEFGEKNFRKGNSEYLILESDEYGAAFLNYSPTLAIITNIDKEHLDFFKNINSIKKIFLEFLKNMRRGGALILNRDNKILFSLKNKIEKIADKNQLQIYWYSIRANPRIYQRLSASLRIPGEHNVSDALAALTAAKLLKIPEKTSLQVMAQYRGAWRRMEYRGNLHMAYSKEHIAKSRTHKPSAISHLPVFDDYAHHPTEISATLKAFREKFPKRKIICAFQPHQAERLKALFKEFQTAFDEADITLILPTYLVPGRDKINPGFTAEKLVREIQKKQTKKLIFYLENPKNLKKALKVLIRNSEHSQRFVDSHYVLVMMGAGDVVKYTDLLLSSEK